MLQHTPSEVNCYNCYKHLKNKNIEENRWQDKKKNNDKIDTTDNWYHQ